MYRRKSDGVFLYSRYVVKSVYFDGIVSPDFRNHHTSPPLLLIHGINIFADGGECAEIFAFQVAENTAES